MKEAELPQLNWPFGSVRKGINRETIISWHALKICMSIGQLNFTCLKDTWAFYLPIIQHHCGMLSQKGP